MKIYHPMLENWSIFEEIKLTTTDQNNDFVSDHFIGTGKYGFQNETILFIGIIIGATLLW